MNDSCSEYDPVEEVANSFLARYRRGERPSLEELAAEHPELAAEIRELLPALIAMEKVGSLGGTPEPAVAAAPGEGGHCPRQLGEYRILRKVGSGGMGVVYEAVQESLGRHVALKVLPKQELAQPTYLERFHREARAAARLHHTNIVPVFGVGEDGGTHYYAMQFIHGQGLDEVLQEVRRLRGSADSSPAKRERSSGALAFEVAQSLLSGRFHLPRADPLNARGEPLSDTVLAAAARRAAAGPQTPPQPSTPPGSGSQSDLAGQPQLQYFRSVARIGVDVALALAYAHQEGILHRDVKPSNLLLDTRGIVWLTDFGLAKAEGSDELTRTGDIVGTLRYMAPERFSGQADARSDVYGLGITLYELLTLRPAFDDGQRLSLMHKVTHEEPSRPRKLDGHIPPELETIVLKTLAKNPDDRYATAQALADDLQRFLDDKPIKAKRPTLVQRTAKWSRRHKSVVWAAMLLLVVAMIGSGIAVVLIAQERDVAKANYEEAQENLDVAYQVLEKIYVDLAEKHLPQSQALAPEDRQVLGNVLKFYERLASRRSTDPEARAKTGTAYLRVAEIQARLGQERLASDNYHQAVALFDKLVAEFPHHSDYRHNLARCYLSLGDVRDRADYSETPEELQQALRQAIRRLEELASEFPRRFVYQQDLAKAYDRLGWVITIPAWRLAFGMPRWGEYFPGRNRTASAIDGWRSLALAGLYKEVEQIFRQALAIRTKLAEEYPNTAAYQMDFNESLGSLSGALWFQGNFLEAEKLQRRTLELRKKLVADFPNIDSYRFHLGWKYSGLGQLLHETGRLQEAEERYRQSLAVREKLVAELPSVPHHRFLVSWSHIVLANLLNQTRRFPEAASACRQAVEISEKLAAEFPTYTLYREILAISHQRLGVVLMNSGEHLASEQHFRRAIDVTSKLVDDFPTIPGYWDQLAILNFELSAVLSKSGRPGEAEQAYRRVKEICEKLAAQFPTDLDRQSCVGARLNDLATESMFLGQWDQARQLLDEAIGHQKRALKLNPNPPPIYSQWLCIYDLNLAEVLQQLRPEESSSEQIRELLREATQCSAHNPESQRHLAWFLATCPDPQFRDPQRAVELGTKLVETSPDNPQDWRTLGVARYRVGDWPAAVTALAKGQALRQGGDSADWFFLAMAHARLGDLYRTGLYYLAAVQRMDKDNPEDNELRRFRAEAEALLGLPNQRPTPRDGGRSGERD